MSKLFIITAPSGAGKTTIIRHLLEKFPGLAFSVSATTRSPRAYEEDGKDYYFLSVEAFQQRIEAGAFAEWEEVYPGKFYGTLRAEIERLWAQGKDILFDIDVQGALSLKKAYPEQSFALFIKPPSLEVLFQRLRDRKTESDQTLLERFEKAKEELQFENKFDCVLVNDVLPLALEEAASIINSQLWKP